MPKSLQEKIEEAEQVAELREKGLSYREIGEELDISKSTAHRRMETWEEYYGEQPANEEEVNQVKALFSLITDGSLEEAVEGTVGAVLGSKESSHRTGLITGSDIVTLKNSLLKLLRGEVSWDRIKFIANNIEGIRDGLTVGDEVSKDVLNAITDRKRKREGIEIEETTEEKVKEEKEG